MLEPLEKIPILFKITHPLFVINKCESITLQNIAVSCVSLLSW